MTTSAASRLLTLFAAATLAFGVGACSSDSSTAQSTNQATDSATSVAPAATDHPTDDGEKRGKIIAIEMRMRNQNAKVDWQGDDLRVTLDGSKDDPNAASAGVCVAIELIAGEPAPDVTLVYDDGEVACSDFE